MNQKVKQILENVDELFPDEEVLDSYFNASDARQSVIEKTLVDFIRPHVFNPAEVEPLDMLVDISNDPQVAKDVAKALKEN